MQNDNQLDSFKNEELKKNFADRVPLDVMVDYSQKNFLRKVGQRWALENYESFEKDTKDKLDALLQSYGQISAQPFPEKAEFALFLGTSTANLCKRAFYLYEAIAAGASIAHVIVLGNTEPYDAYLGCLRTIVAAYPDYFREGFSPEQIPEHATMHEVMIFILDNLKWPQGKKPSVIELDLPHPSNTNHEVSAVVNYLMNKPHITDKPLVVTLSHQPFNDRQGITALGAFIAADLSHAFALVSAGPGVDTYPLLNKMPASTMSPAQIVDNLTRTLYEISCKADALLKSPKAKNVPVRANRSTNVSSGIDGLITMEVFPPTGVAQQDLHEQENSAAYQNYQEKTLKHPQWGEDRDRGDENKMDKINAALVQKTTTSLSEAKLGLFKPQLKNNEVEAAKKEEFEKFEAFFEANCSSPEIAKKNVHPHCRQSLFTNEGRIILVESECSNPENGIDSKPVFP